MCLLVGGNKIWSPDTSWLPSTKELPALIYLSPNPSTRAESFFLSFFGFETWIAICRIATSDKRRAHHSKAQVSANNAILSPRVCPSVNVPTAFYKCHRGDFFLRLFAHWPVCCIQMSFYTCHNVISTWIYWYCLHYDIKDNTYELRKIYIGWAGSKDYIGSVSS